MPKKVQEPKDKGPKVGTTFPMLREEWDAILVVSTKKELAAKKIREGEEELHKARVEELKVWNRMQMRCGTCSGSKVLSIDPHGMTISVIEPEKNQPRLIELQVEEEAIMLSLARKKMKLEEWKMGGKE